MMSNENFVEVEEEIQMSASTALVTIAVAKGGRARGYEEVAKGGRARECEAVAKGGRAQFNQAPS